MPDYANGALYVIQVGEKKYVGSTTSYKRRVNQHRANIFNKGAKEYGALLYSSIRENDGRWEMSKLKDFPCADVLELKCEEQKMIQEQNADLNQRATYWNREEYYHKNKERISMRHKDYYIKNKEKMRENQRDRYNVKKDEILRKGREAYHKKKALIEAEM